MSQQREEIEARLQTQRLEVERRLAGLRQGVFQETGLVPKNGPWVLLAVGGAVGLSLALGVSKMLRSKRRSIDGRRTKS